MKFIIVICLVLIVWDKSFCQDSLHRSDMQAAVKVLKEDGYSFVGYKRLPKYIRRYMDKRFDGKFRLPKHKFNATDMGSRRYSRRYLYSVISKDVCILAYEHGGSGYHCHAIIFRIDGINVTDMYNMVTKKHQISELEGILENDSYIFQEYDDF